VKNASNTAMVEELNPKTTREKLHQAELDKREADAQHTDFSKPAQIMRDGKAIVIPKAMRPEEAVKWVDKWATAEQKVVRVVEEIEGIPIDAAHALQLAIVKEFGFTEFKGNPGFFGETPPQFIAVPKDHLGNTVDVYIGRMSLPGFEDGYILTQPKNNSALVVGGQVKAKDKELFKQLIKTAREMLLEQSLYKGKAITLDFGNTAYDAERNNEVVLPTFYDVSQPQTVILNRDTEALIDAVLLTPIKRREALRKLNIPLKRCVLLNGGYGTGKTLLAKEAARVATEHGFTFVYMKDAKQLADGFRFVSKHYLPGILFCEDMDGAFEDSYQVQAIQNTLDGIDTKGSEIIIVLTTNFIEKIPAGIVRPGRIDTLISFVPPDAEAAARLVKHYAGSLLDENADMQIIGEAIQGNIPAVIREIVERAKLFGLSRDSVNGGHIEDGLVLTTEDIVLSAKGMQQHLALLNKDSIKLPSPIEFFGGAIGKPIADAITKRFDKMAEEEKPKRLAQGA
jgi:transitional endoplasmic reticulum ATPase